MMLKIEPRSRTKRELS